MVLGTVEARNFFRICATAARLGSGQSIGAHTGAGRQITGAIKVAVGAEGPAHTLHTSTGSGGLGRAKGGHMPDWADRMASY